MTTNFTFRHIDSTDGIREHTEAKLTKLNKYFQHEPESIHVILSVENHDHVAEITISVDGHRVVGHASSTDMYASIDSTIHKVEDQLRKIKEKRTHHKGHTPASGHTH